MKDVLGFITLPVAIVLVIIGLTLLQVKVFWEIFNEQFSKN